MTKLRTRIDVYSLNAALELVQWLRLAAHPSGKQPEVSAEHALHVIEIMNAARESQRTGKRIDIKSRFTLPTVKGP